MYTVKPDLISSLRTGFSRLLKPYGYVHFTYPYGSRYFTCVVLTGEKQCELCEVGLMFGVNSVLYLQRISIYPKYQRKGLGTRILSMLEGIARQNGFSAFCVQSVITQEMMNLCSKLGYTRTIGCNYEVCLY